MWKGRGPDTLRTSNSTSSLATTRGSRTGGTCTLDMIGNPVIRTGLPSTPHTLLGCCKQGGKDSTSEGRHSKYHQEEQQQVNRSRLKVEKA